ncbi:spore coat protein [Sutcliffiella cohnii]|uniref:spore coat protein n=1 Tax=Sutcliffiella TaxID=2837511 RepID=UPI000A0607D7|nr:MULTISPECIES: spore coat protein [Sutcliffiella]MED4018648.1 spore coat protein [Sutcliffiella cohnii]WBL13062.1 spore coat protein [Sutcliffiella sp. NC1]
MGSPWLFDSGCDRRHQASIFDTGCDRRHHTKRWSALDDRARHPLCKDDVQQSVQENKVIQESYEQIIIEDSCDIDVITIDTKAAVSLQAAIQAAIDLVLNLSIADSTEAQRISQELVQKSKTVQVNKQQTLIRNSKNVSVRTADTDLVINIQLLLQILVALIIRVGVL